MADQLHVSENRRLTSENGEDLAGEALPDHLHDAADIVGGESVASHVADTVDAHDASAISYAGATGLVATDVEAALDELDAEKAAAADLTAHTGDTIDAHDASAISVLDSAANFDGTDVEAVLAEIASGEYVVNTVAASGATETLTLAPAHKVTMDQNCTFTFPTPTAGHTFLLWLSGAFTPTFPASVDWNSATAPTYATPSLYGFTTLDGGTTWAGTLIASGLG